MNPQLPAWAWVLIVFIGFGVTIFSSTLGAVIVSKLNGNGNGKRNGGKGKTDMFECASHNQSVQRLHERTDEIKTFVATIDKNTGIIATKVDVLVEKGKDHDQRITNLESSKRKG